MNSPVVAAYPWLPTHFTFVRTRQNGRFWDAQCPLKKHSHAVVTFWLGTDGRLCFKDFAGCDKLAILRAVGRSWKDCFPETSDWKTIPRTLVRQHHYKDENGTILYTKERWEPGYNGSDKTFRLRKPDGSWGIEGCRRVLYHLPLLLARPHEPVYIVEGESDADSLIRIGLLGTCNVSGGSEPWGEHYSLPLAHRDITVIADNDPTGWRHAHEVAGALLHHAQSLRITSTPDKDVSAFLLRLQKEGITDKNSLQHQLFQIIHQAPQWRRIP